VTRASGRLALLVGLLALPRLVRAQSSTASVSADAVVVTTGITLTSLRDLAFGSVPKGAATTVAPGAANAGAWQVVGNGNAFVSITLTLPSALTNVQAVPGVTMPLSFGNTSALWRRATNNPSGATAFNPQVGTTGRLGPPANPSLYIWIGGTVSPSAAQLPGIYVGTIIVSLAYL